MNLLKFAHRWRVVHNCSSGCADCKEFDAEVHDEVDKAARAARAAKWYNDRVGVLEDIYVRLGEHAAQGRLDSDVWYKITRLRQDG